MPVAKRRKARRNSIRAEIQEHEIRGLLTRAQEKTHTPFIVWDISDEGLGLWIAVKLRMDEEVTLTLAKPKTVVLKAKVMWCRTRENDQGFHCGVYVIDHKNRLASLFKAIVGTDLDPAVSSLKKIKVEPKE